MSAGSGSRPGPRGGVGERSGAPPFCDGCGRPVADGSHERCAARRAATDPPRYCVQCGRRLVVQVLPTTWTARCVRCGPLPAPGS